MLPASPYLETPDSKGTVEAILEQVRARHQARIYAYVLMPEHVHLLMSEPPSILVAQFLKSLKQMTSRKLKGGRERFWQERYFDGNVYGEAARSEVIRYIHRNPVKRGLAASPEQYPWSSFSHYATGVRGGGDRVGVDGLGATPAHRGEAAMNGAQLFSICAHHHWT